MIQRSSTPPITKGILKLARQIDASTAPQYVSVQPGDGAIRNRPERAFEAYYNVGVTKFFWLTLDYQRVANPAYNADRGPVNIYGFRLHAEF